MENTVIKGKVIEAMRADRKFREQGYSLHKDFAGKYDNFQVVYAKNSDNKENNFRLRCKSPSGAHSIAGYMIGNALLVPKDTTLPKEGVSKDISGVWYFDQVAEATRTGQSLHQLMDDKDGLELPDSFTVLGAAVGKDTAEDHPYIPLSRYPRYQALLTHHKKVNPDATYITRDEIEDYIKLEGEERPKGIPSDYELKLRNHDKAIWDMSMWMPTLIIEDWRSE